ncbi:MAG: hypothetical protein ACYCSR_11230 [Thiomonas sp.]
MNTLTDVTMPHRSKPLNIQIQWLIGMLVAIAILAIFLGLLRLRRNQLPVDVAELQMRADSPCMVQAIDQGTQGGRQAITYAQLDALRTRCGD